jgi:hypothetical protein
VETRSFDLKTAAQNSNGFRLDGKTVVVTGGASGIGRTIW